MLVSRFTRAIRSSPEWSTWSGRTEAGIAATMPITSPIRSVTSPALRNGPLLTQPSR